MLSQFLTAGVLATAAADPTPGYMTQETLTVGVNTTVVGMLIVFLMLIVLYIVTSLLSKAIEASEKKKVAPAPAPKVIAAPVPAAAPVVAAPAPAPAPAPALPAGLSPKTVAAVMAAVAAASGKPVSQLRFNAVRRLPGAVSAWSGSGTAEIINTRQQYL